MAPKTFIFIALVLSGVFSLNTLAVCLAQSADHSEIIDENQAHKVLSTKQQIETKPVVKKPLKNRRNAIFYMSSPAMYADNMEIIAADEKQG
jgi:hypothetical protein